MLWPRVVGTAEAASLPTVRERTRLVMLQQGCASEEAPSALLHGALVALVRVHAGVPFTGPPVQQTSHQDPRRLHLDCNGALCGRFRVSPLQHARSALDRARAGSSLHPVAPRLSSTSLGAQANIMAAKCPAKTESCAQRTGLDGTTNSGSCTARGCGRRGFRGVSSPASRSSASAIPGPS